jgi:basic membrane protein A
MPRIALVLLLAASLVAGCAPQPADCARAQVFCVGLVTDFGGVEAGIAHEAWLGLQDLRDANVVDRIDKIETVDVQDRAANIKAFADAGYDVIVTVGASMSDATTKAAKQHANLYFVGVEQPQAQVLPNVAGLVFHEEYSGYLAGWLAALMSETGRVAAICEAQFVEPMRRYCDGFRAGAKRADPKVDSSVTYRDGTTDTLFNDPNWGRNAALEAVEGGADVVFAAGGITANAALQAAAGQGAYVIGSESDLYGSLALLRPRLLTSVMNDVRSGLSSIVRSIRGSEFRPGDTFGDVALAPWHDLDRQIPTVVKNQVRNIAVELKAGTLDTGVPYEKAAKPASPKPTATPKP